jgi:transposase InsO family protein
MNQAALLIVRTVLKVLADVGRFISLALQSRTHLAAENLFLRKQLALYQERQLKPRRANDATRITLVALSRLVDWRQLLVVVKPETLIRWHRKGFRQFWHWKSNAPGRPRIPSDLRQLIGEMAAANRTWGEERIAAELLVKLGIRVSPRTVRRYMPTRTAPRARRGSQVWSTFVRNHARSVLACDFFVAVTATFRVVYVFVVMEISTRRIVNWNLTAHPTAEWTAQQFRMIIPGDQAYRYVIHDRDSIYSDGVDRTLAAMGLTVLKTPVRAPQANAFCERLVGTIRRECLDFAIPLNERHLRSLLKAWVTHYNQGRPHASLGPGLPNPPLDRVVTKAINHRIPEGHRVVATPILGGLHHEYRLEARVA